MLTPRAVGLLPVCLTMKPVGEPDALIGHVRFDERGWETERCRMAQATAPILDSTITDQWDVTRDTRPQGTEQGRALNLRFATWTYVLSNPCPLEWASLSFRRRR